MGVAPTDPSVAALPGPMFEAACHIPMLYNGLALCILLEVLVAPPCPDPAAPSDIAKALQRLGTFADRLPLLQPMHRLWAGRWLLDRGGRAKAAQLLEAAESRSSALSMPWFGATASLFRSVALATGPARDAALRALLPRFQDMGALFRYQQVKALSHAARSLGPGESGGARETQS